MKGLKALLATMAAVGLLVVAVPASAGAAAYTHYVACGESQNAKPSHVCQKQRTKGAFFRSNTKTVFYTVCVKFPSKTKPLCAESQEAEQGVLYFNKITSTISGEHKVTWFVEGKRIGTFIFNVPK